MTKINLLIDCPIEININCNMNKDLLRQIVLTYVNNLAKQKSFNSKLEILLDEIMEDYYE